MCRGFISNCCAFVTKTSGLINSCGLTGESSQVGVTLEINLHRKHWVIGVRERGGENPELRNERGSLEKMTNQSETNYEAAT